MSVKSSLSSPAKLYLFFAILGTAIPVYMFIEFFRLEGLSFNLLIQKAFTNWASSALVSDLLVSSFVYWVLLSQALKSLKKPPSTAFIFILLNIFIGLSCSLPIFLFWRETQKAS